MPSDSHLELLAIKYTYVKSKSKNEVGSLTHFPSLLRASSE